MNHVPPSVRAALQRRNRQDILDQEGEYAQFKDDIERIIHGDDQGTQRNEDIMIPDFEEDISPEEKKVDKAVEGYAAKHDSDTTSKLTGLNKEGSKNLSNYVVSKSDIDKATETDYISNEKSYDEMMFKLNKIADKYDEDGEMSMSEVYEHASDEDKQQIAQIINKYSGLGEQASSKKSEEGSKKEEFTPKNEPVTTDEPDPRVNETKMFEEFDSWASPEDYKEQALNAIKWQGNWDVADMVRREEWFGSDFDYDSMDDEKLSDEFYERVESGEISGEDAFKALTGRMSDDDVKDYAEFYGLIDEEESSDISDEDDSEEYKVSKTITLHDEEEGKPFTITKNGVIVAGADSEKEGYEIIEKMKNNGSGKQPSEDISDDEISEALADYQWQITDKTTVADYARETAEKLGVDKNRVLKMIKSESPDIKDTDKMSKVAGLEDEESQDYKIDKNGNKYLEFSSEKEAHGYANNHDLPDGTVVYDNKIYFPPDGDKVNQIKPKYPYKDFGNLRYYPTESRMEGNRWVGNYHSIHDAFGLNDFYRGENKQEPYKGTSIVQLPDGYFSINPNITSMSFKTRKDLEDYLDHEYDDDYRNYDFKDDIQVMRKREDGQDEAPVDAYIRAKTKQSEQADRESVAKVMRESLKIPGDEVESILKGMNKESYEKLLKWIKTPRD